MVLGLIFSFGLGAVIDIIGLLLGVLFLIFGRQNRVLKISGWILVVIFGFLALIFLSMIFSHPGLGTFGPM